MPKPAATKAKTKPSRDRVRVHREKLRKKGLKPIQFWVPDVKSEEYKANIRRQCVLIANSPQEEEDIAFVQSLIAWDEL
jgi:Protein  of unknown function (DUF3018)